MHQVHGWILAPGGKCHALARLKPSAKAVCGRENFRGGAHLSGQPKRHRICVMCARELGIEIPPEPEPKHVEPVVQLGLF